MKRADARRVLVSRFLQASGPVTLQEVSTRFGWTERATDSILKKLVGEGSVARGHFLSNRPSPQFCWQANLEVLHRQTLERLKAEIQPLSLSEYSDFLLRWQYAHPSTRRHGRDGLLEVLRRLEGYGTFPQLWKRDIPSSRVDDFDPAWLGELIEDGPLIFGRFCLRGWANYAPGGGTVLCQPLSKDFTLAVCSCSETRPGR